MGKKKTQKKIEGAELSVEDRLQRLEETYSTGVMDIQTLVGRIDAAKEIIDGIQERQEDALTAMADVRMLDAIQAIPTAILEGFKNLVDYKVGAEERFNQRRQRKPPFKRVQLETPPKDPVDRIIDQTHAKFPNLTVKAIKSLIYEERAKAAGLLTEEAAAHLVASNLGLDASSSLPDLSGIDWRDGEYGQYVYSDNYQDLYYQLQQIGGKADYGDFTVKIGKNTKYINRYENKQKRSQSSQGGRDYTIRDPDSPATDRQLAKLREWKVFINPGLTKGVASKLIEYKLAEFKAKKR